MSNYNLKISDAEYLHFESTCYDFLEKLCISCSTFIRLLYELKNNVIIKGQVASTINVILNQIKNILLKIINIKNDLNTIITDLIKEVDVLDGPIY